MAAVTVRAQAKVNLFLRVTGREASGYHTLETLFCRIALADIVSVRLTRTSRSLDCTGPQLPPRGLGTVAENLAWRAAVAYAGVARWPAGFEIDLEKHIPVSAGLAGGSADAGAVLRAFNALNPRPLARKALHDIACALGADVPFLTQDQTPLAIAFGRGDAWHALEPLPERICVLAMPQVGVASRDAYSWLDAARGWHDRGVTLTRDRELARPLTWDAVREAAHNDFEAVVLPRHPEIAAARKYLVDLVGGDSSGFALMSGSGAASFALIAGARAPSQASAPTGVRIIATRTASRVESVETID